MYEIQLAIDGYTFTEKVYGRSWADALVVACNNLGYTVKGIIGSVHSASVRTYGGTMIYADFV